MTTQATLAALFVACAVAYADETVRIVGASRVNIRSGPGAEHPASSVAMEGEEARSGESSNREWISVTFPDGRKGYIRSRFLSSSSTSSAEKADTPSTPRQSRTPPLPSAKESNMPQLVSELTKAKREKVALTARNQELEKELEATKEKLRGLMKLNEEQNRSLAKKPRENPVENGRPTLSEIKALRAEVSGLERRLRAFENELDDNPLRENLPMGSIRDHLGTTILGIGILMVGCILGARYVRWKDKVQRTRLHF